MIPLTWWIAANTAVTALAVSLAAFAFLRRDQHCRQACTVAQSCERHVARAVDELAHIGDLLDQRLTTDPPTDGPVRFEPPETPAERTQPHGDLPLLCGDDRPVSGRHALADDTRHLPHVGDLTGGDHR